VVTLVEAEMVEPSDRQWGRFTALRPLNGRWSATLLSHLHTSAKKNQAGGWRRDPLPRVPSSREERGGLDGTCAYW
jgi:hypothetical protein